LEIDPLLWGLLASLLAGIGVSLSTAPPDEVHLSNLFDADPVTEMQTA
jgi:hypothetical protein